MKKLVGIALLAISLFGGEIKVYTENYPPYNMKEDGKLTGLSVEVLQAMYKEMGNSQAMKDIVHTNWARGYGQALNTKNSMVFSTTRTKAREDLFKWVGPITKTTIGLIAPKDRNIVIHNDNDMNKYKIIVVAKDIGDIILAEKGINKKNIKVAKGTHAVYASFKRMEKGKVDMFAYETKASFDTVKNDGIKKSDYKIVYTLKEGELYFAFNKKTSDTIITKWQKALDTIKSNGVFNTITDKY